MKNQFHLCAGIFVLSGIVSGCGGGGAGGAEPNVAPASSGSAADYQPLSDTAAGSSNIGGTAWVDGGGSRLSGGTGTLNHANGAVALTISNEALTDSDITLDSDQFDGDYEYVTPFRANTINNGTSYSFTGTYGVLTEASHMPSTGSVTYTGEAAGVLVVSGDSGSSGYDLTGGQSSVTADFGAGTVNATLDSFTITDQLSSEVSNGPLDTISISDMTISGNGFSGGTVETTLSGNQVNLLGANANSSAQGDFFGYDDTASAPDEVGGSVLVQSDTGTLAATFIAD